MKNKNDKSIKTISLNAHCMGYSEQKDNCWNFSITSTDPNNKAVDNEYFAGYIQGKLQGHDMLKASRNNTWDNTYLCSAEHIYPKQLGPTADELLKAEKVLVENYDHLLLWIRSNKEQGMVQSILRLLYRMFGIYDGAVGITSDSTTLEERILQKKIPPESFRLGYGDTKLSLGDTYFINAQMDLFDVVSNSLEATYGKHKSDHCSAFLKRTDDDIYWTHNSWCGYLSQSHTITYVIRNDNGDKDEQKNIDFITQNSYCPGQFGSNMDFGFNGHGICFNETTHRYSRNKSRADGIWLCWRAAAAEMFAQSIDDFYNYITLDNTGTYLNGYMLIDVKTNETALLEMSYKRFVLFRSDGEKLTVTDSTGEIVTEKDYDQKLISPNYILGVNYPVSNKVAADLGSSDNRPMRRIQFLDQIDTVKNMEAAKALITYVDNDEPLSIYGRWDLGKGTTEYPKTIPDGAVDAKAYSAGKVRELLKGLRYRLNGSSRQTSFWMLYGTSKIDGKPFIWSKSQWAKFKKSQHKDFVPDALEGAWNETKLFID